MDMDIVGLITSTLLSQLANAGQERSFIKKREVQARQYVDDQMKKYEGEEWYNTLDQLVCDNTIDILNKGMECLTETLGVVGAEQFISVIIRERFDYTKWQRQHFDAMAPGEFHQKAVEYAQEHPYTGKAKRL